MKKLLSILTVSVVSLFFFWSCEVTVSPVAKFSGTPKTLKTGQSVNFTDLSTGVPETWEWTFEGASVTSSTEENPNSITYDTDGTFDVTLTVTNSVGNNSTTISNYITVEPSEYNILFWSNFDGPNMQVFCSDNQSDVTDHLVGRIESYYDEEPVCGASGCVTVTRTEPGTIYYFVSDGTNTPWSGSITFNNSCTAKLLNLGKNGDVTIVSESDAMPVGQKHEL